MSKTVSVSVRINEYDRSQIVQKCLVDTKAKGIDELLADGAQLVMWILEEHAPKEVINLYRNKSPWLNRNAYFTVRGEGFVSFSFHASHHYGTPPTTGLQRFFPVRTDENVRLKGALAQKVTTYRNAWDDAIAKYELTRRNLQVLLKQCKSYKDLERLWPEGEAYYKYLKVEPEAKSLLPMIDVAALNAALGLPKEKRP